MGLVMAIAALDGASSRDRIIQRGLFEMAIPDESFLLPCYSSVTSARKERLRWSTWKNTPETIDSLKRRGENASAIRVSEGKRTRGRKE